MSDVVIRAENLGKKYIIGHQAERERYVALRDVIARNVGNFGRSLRDIVRGAANVAGDELEEFWALKNVNFEISRGDVVGIIGRNGAGKSTLLKVLSRITEPSEGRVEIKGRVASLLEVGTGFHPELTGRENIYLNGAILGMRRDEIKRKFDEIVAFSEIEKFLDTPVKRYSSGMYVRLAFAVAAHLEPEILVVDEVLAVGDAEFQKKCLGKMQDVAGHGRTVLFVSHNMGAVRALCKTAFLLRNGRLVSIGDTMAISAEYAAGSAGSSWQEVGPSEKPYAIRSAFLELLPHDLLRVTLDVASAAPKRLIVNALLQDAVGAPVGMASLGGYDPDQLVDLSEGESVIAFDVRLPALANGRYRVDVNLEEPYGHFLDHVTGELEFAVDRTPRNNHGRVLDVRWGAGCIELASATQIATPRGSDNSALSQATSSAPETCIS
ncbi:MAG: ABC transporter ATP-binding protein [Hyphomonadaceae bacterium]|nr:ABC transporter ATP-binding protein [Hyphomonadaceae bacterium]MBY0565124.1 ABC transporter ATP-binding protein [Hyphomonadaceae bacterium]